MSITLSIFEDFYCVTACDCEPKFVSSNHVDLVGSVKVSAAEGNSLAAREELVLAFGYAVRQIPARFWPYSAILAIHDEAFVARIENYLASLTTNPQTLSQSLLPFKDANDSSWWHQFEPGKMRKFKIC